MIEVTKEGCTGYPANLKARIYNMIEANKEGCTGYPANLKARYRIAGQFLGSKFKCIFKCEINRVTRSDESLIFLSFYKTFKL
jgi:hypothetical protein